MKQFIQKLKSIGFGLLFSSALIPGAAQAELAVETMANFTSYPVVSAEGVTPMVMIASSVDHQLFFKAYNDFSDLDGDGVIDITYKHDFEYYGYFASGTCYDYSSGVFEPDDFADGDNYCDGSSWSGNFLNWATMTRVDTVRKILFGGLRSTDTSSSTILERAYLPNDAHSFAKYYTGSDINKLTPFSTTELTICNTTESNTSPSEDVTDPPLLRIANGNYALWASNERWQCRWRESGNHTNANDAAASGINAASSNPQHSSNRLGAGDYQVRVKACVTGFREKNCKRYPDGNYKPTGLLQTYGDDDKVLFGMMAGSYSKNKSGGTLVKDVSSMADEIDVNGDGTFIDAVTSGRATNQADGIINAWSLYRVVGYRHSDGTYGTSGVNANNCSWGVNSFNDGQCMNWGNPFSELYYNAIRYFGGQSTSGQYRANDSSIIDGLNTPNNWDCPLDDSNYCASLNVIAFNSSTISYDSDQLDGAGYGVGNIWSGTTSSGLTDVVGAGEGIHGNDYFVGENGVDNNQLCTQKTVTSLGSVEGLCPEAPRLEGTYRIAGIAHRAHTDDIRPSGSTELEGDQLVDTYAVTLAPALPEITVPVPGSTNTLKILPACRNNSINGNCALVDFKIVQPHTETTILGITVGTGKFYINWEDSEQGGDFDQDMWGVLSYRVTSLGTIEVTTDVIQQSTGDRMGFGYVISGTTQDGFHVHSGINNFDYNDPNILVTDCNNCTTGNGATDHTYLVSGSSAGLLKDPLFYAAKWGAFADENGNGVPDLDSEWDRKDTNGNLGADGLPDTYFYATNPQELENSLINVLNAIIAKTASGTAASVVASSRQGQGTVVQALYQTEHTYQDKTVNWIGSLHALWVDEQGLIREDAGTNGKLDDYQTDRVVNVYYDTAARRARVCAFDSTSATDFVPVILNAGAECEANSLPLEELNALWNAREQLSSLNSSNIATQRIYNLSAANGRHILSWVDKDLDREIDTGEVVDFTTSGMDTANYYGFLNAENQSDADTIVNYIRGEEFSSTRNRTIDFDGDGTEEVMRLGDIVHSTPQHVSVPAEQYHLLYGDTSYAAFIDKYRDRRNMIYVGANDGLLHAFNGGFYDPVDIEFKTSNAGETAHPLGSELWAYAPGNLLPHLKWLTDNDYTHVNYMDAQVRVTDAKIFSYDSSSPTTGTHPYGWGTIAITGMRFGGGKMTVDTAQDGLGGANAADDHEFRSAYVIMDVTDPEQPPTVLAELTHENLGYTTSFPTPMVIRDPATGAPSKFYLVFGTGPTNITSATSTQDGRLLVYDLGTKTWVTDFGPTDTTNIVASNAFVSHPVTADWDLNFKADDVYVGYVSGTPTSPSGGLYRLQVNEDTNPGNWVFSERLDVNQPISMRPTLTIDNNQTHYVFAGTGRFYITEDKTSSTQQTLYGFRDNPPSGASTALPATSNMVDVSNAVIDTDTGHAVTGVSGVTNFTELEGLFQATGTAWKDGWKLNLPLPSGGDPSTRMVQEGAMLGDVLLIPDYTPSVSLCEGDGTSSLYALYYKTGTAHAESPALGTTGTIADEKVELGSGLASAPSLHVANDRDNITGASSTEKVILQNTRGQILTEDAELGNPIRSGETTWREVDN